MDVTAKKPRNHRYDLIVEFIFHFRKLVRRFRTQPNRAQSETYASTINPQTNAAMDITPWPHIKTPAFDRK